MATYRITNGPAKVDFVTRYFFADLQLLKPFEFTLELPGGGKIIVQPFLEKCDWEDGTGDAWLIGGGVSFGPVHLRGPFTGSYNTRTREGTFETEGQKPPRWQRTVEHPVS